MAIWGLLRFLRNDHSLLNIKKDGYEIIWTRKLSKLMCARPESWNHQSWETKASYLMVKPEKNAAFHEFDQKVEWTGVVRYLYLDWGAGPWAAAAGGGWRARTPAWLLHIQMRSRSTLWKNWTNWSTGCARWQPSWTGVLAGSWNRFGPQIWRWGWWGKSANWRTHQVGRNWHISKRRCRWAVTQCSHWMIKFACRPKLALSTLCIVRTSWSTLIKNVGSVFNL